MKLKLNREFAVRHLFVAVLLFGMACWFAYDGYVTYPSMTPEALYEKIERSTPPSHEEALRVYGNAIPRQKQFMALCFAGAIIVGFGVLRAYRFDFEYDESGFVFKGRRMGYGDIKALNDSQWKKKGILSLETANGKIVLDAWHNTGVDGFYGIVAAKTKADVCPQDTPLRDVTKL